MADRLLPPGYQVFDSNGAPLSGAQLFAFESGTSTPQDTYSDSDGLVANTNPVVADSAGRFGPVFGGASAYKLALKTAAGVTIWTADPVTGGAGASAATQTEVDTRTTATKYVSPSTIAGGVGLQGASIASASSLTLPPVGDYFVVNGTTGITALSTRTAGRRVLLRFAGVVTLTHSTSLNLGGSDITTAADDVMAFVSEGAGTWRLVVPSHIVTGDQTIRSTDPGASVGPILAFDRNSPSPAAFDRIGDIVFTGRNSAGTAVDYARTFAAILDPTSTSEDGQLQIQAVVAGVMSLLASFGPGVQIGSAPTGGDKGVGTINVQNGIYKNGAAIAGIAQVVNTESGAVATGTTAIPQDDTIPQNTEGDQYLTLAITPKNSSSILYIDAILYLSSSAAGGLVAALFQDSTASAIAVGVSYQSQIGGVTAVSIRHKMTAGTTSATTFKIRAGQTNAGTTTFNGTSGGRLYGGTFASQMTITEVLP